MKDLAVTFERPVSWGQFLLKKGDQRFVRGTVNDCLRFVKQGLARPALKEAIGPTEAIAPPDKAAFRELLELYQQQELAPKEKEAKRALAQVDADRAAIELLLSPDDGEALARSSKAELVRNRYDYRERLQQGLQRMAEARTEANQPMPLLKKALELEAAANAALAADNFAELEDLLRQLTEHTDALRNNDNPFRHRANRGVSFG